jgi:hypothetical protein
MLMPLAILVIVVGLGAFATDISHNVSTRTELHNATDAAALAGGYDLIQTSTENQASNDAYQTAEENSADGKLVSNNSPGTWVDVQILPGALPIAQQCQVQAQTHINNIWAKIVGHDTDPVGEVSTATGYSAITAIKKDSMFPMAVSIDQPSQDGTMLWQHKVGDTVTFYINSQGYKNASYTSFTTKNTNAQWINKAIDSALGLNPVPGLIPAVAIGDGIYLDNGVSGTKDLTTGVANQALINDSNLVMPVIQGPPAYNQSRPVVGFIAVQIFKVGKNNGNGNVLQFQAKIVKGIVKGTPGTPPPIGYTQMNSALITLSPGTVQLTPTDTSALKPWPQ